VTPLVHLSQTTPLIVSLPAGVDTAWAKKAGARLVGLREQLALPVCVFHTKRSSGLGDGGAMTSTLLCV
jgi:hypothetical protein